MAQRTTSRVAADAAASMEEFDSIVGSALGDELLGADLAPRALAAAHRRWSAWDSHDARRAAEDSLLEFLDSVRA